MTRSTFLALLTLSATLLGASISRAEMVEYHYRWSSPNAVVAGTNPDNITGNGLSSGSVAIALAADGVGSSLLGDATYIPATSLTTTGSAPFDHPDRFASPFSFTLHLTDTASGVGGDLTFAGVINGALTFDTSTLTLDFTDPLTQQLTLGNRVYSVTIDPASASIPAPGVPASLVAARVQVDPGDGSQPPVMQVPEPSVLLLAGVGVPLLGVLFRKRRLR